ncbi:MAG: UDP-2,3-diacylglucosamine diphosphatase LpxI [Candidatus Gastranaerophilales bacterium]|nr:UDP-2,3-diacylglucosamine diphosphatase LpxI [Candidatus Gastranaerophilales bacterium]
MSNLVLEHIQCLVAGDGNLPVQMAKSAKQNGFEVICVSLSSDNYKELKKYCTKVVSYGPGQVDSIRKFLKDEGIKQLTFLGKVSKTMLVKRPKLEKSAIAALKELRKLNDDAIMLKIISLMEEIGITILDQTIFIKNLMVQKGVLTKNRPSDAQTDIINYGFNIAKQMGGLDIGQSVVMKDRMIMAIEAIEGTDRCIKRGGKLARRKNAIVVKVSKPHQDKRFDIPAVGLRTIRTMKKYGANVLALESGETIIVDQDKMVDYANKHNMIIVAI